AFNRRTLKTAQTKSHSAARLRHAAEREATKADRLLDLRDVPRAEPNSAAGRRGRPRSAYELVTSRVVDPRYRKLALTRVRPAPRSADPWCAQPVYELDPTSRAHP